MVNVKYSQAPHSNKKLTDIIFLALLVIHVGTVVLWMGASVLFVSVLGPSMAKLTGSSRIDLFKAIGSRYERYVVRNATVAIVAGLILYIYINQVATSLAPGSEAGKQWLLVGIVFGLIAYIIGIGVVMRGNRKLMRLINQASAGQATDTPSGGMSQVQRRVAMGAGLQALFLALALLSMVVGANI